MLGPGRAQIALPLGGCLTLLKKEIYPAYANKSYTISFTLLLANHYLRYLRYSLYLSNYPRQGRLGPGRAQIALPLGGVSVLFKNHPAYATILHNWFLKATYKSLFK